jgi:hypothetical protein
LRRSKSGSTSADRKYRSNTAKLDRFNIKEEYTTTKYALEGYKTFFSTKLARQYEPIVYSGECMSGDPEALYYRIVQIVEKSGDHSHTKIDLCIQYFYFWQYQNCMMTSHGYDYEPIFIYLSKRSNDSKPYLIVNGGLGGPNCRFHKNEVRPRNGKTDRKTQNITANLSPYPYYPFGQNGNIKCHECVNVYPLNTGEDLQFENKGQRPLFGIRACSNVFSGAQGDLHGHRFRPPLKKLTDRVLDQWYFHHYKNSDDMPFGHDIADPFSTPYIKFRKPSKEEIDNLKKHR